MGCLWSYTGTHNDLRAPVGSYWPQCFFFSYRYFSVYLLANLLAQKSKFARDAMNNQKYFIQQILSIMLSFFYSQSIFRVRQLEMCQGTFQSVKTSFKGISHLTHYEMTNFRLFQTERDCRQFSNLTKMAASYPNR